LTLCVWGSCLLVHSELRCSFTPRPRGTRARHACACTFACTFRTPCFASCFACTCKKIPFWRRPDAATRGEGARRACHRGADQLVSSTLRARTASPSALAKGLTIMIGKVESGTGHPSSQLTIACKLSTTSLSLVSLMTCALSTAHVLSSSLLILSVNARGRLRRARYSAPASRNPAVAPIAGARTCFCLCSSLACLA